MRLACKGLSRFGRSSSTTMAAAVSRTADLLGCAPPASRPFAAAAPLPAVIAAEIVALDYADLVAGKDLTPEIERGKKIGRRTPLQFFRPGPVRRWEGGGGVAHAHKTIADEMFLLTRLFFARLALQRSRIVAWGSSPW
jgi:hypothetical protein